MIIIGSLILICAGTVVLTSTASIDNYPKTKKKEV